VTVRRNESDAGQDPGLSVVDLFRILRRGALFALLLAATAGGAALLLTSRMTPTYAATVGVVASQPQARFGEFGLVTPPVVDPGVYQSVLLEGDVVAEALLRLDGVRPSERQLEDFIKTMRVRIENTQMSGMVWIEVRHPSPAYAAAAVNAIADRLILWDRERASRAIDRSIAAIEASLATLDVDVAAAQAAGDTARVTALTGLRAQRESELGMARATRANALVVGLLEPLRLAAPPDEPVGPRVLFITLAATVLGLALGYAVQLVRWSLDTRVGGRAEVMDTTGLPVLAEFPRLGRRSARLSTESAGFFRTNVVLATRTMPWPRVLVITSPSTPQEKAGVAISLAESFARSGQRTLLVDADMRSEGVTSWLGLVPASAVPLEVFLANPDRSYAPVKIAMIGKRSFDFVPSFSSERYPVDLINSGFAVHLEAWKQAYDVILLDATPVLPFADALSMAPLASGVVLCASVRLTEHDQLTEAVDVLGRSHVHVLGIVLTDLSRPPVRQRAGTAVTDSGVDEPYRTQVATSIRPVDRAIDERLAASGTDAGRADARRARK
jgi:polysaccharide biosynthesis transport protein